METTAKEEIIEIVKGQIKILSDWNESHKDDNDVDIACYLSGA